jgi:GMP synthase PP-ATPase subunit
MEDPLKTVEGSVVVLVSGGVDSAVAGYMVKRSGIPAYYWFIDNGLQREGEAHNIQSRFAEIGIHVKVLNARKHFLGILKDCESGEEKRDAVGDALVRKAMKIANKEGTNALVFGTIKNDLLVCDSSTVTEMEGYNIIEPLRGMMKEEVIRHAKSFGLDGFTRRQHFPGVGFAIRIEGKVKLQKIKLISYITDFLEKQLEGCSDYFAYFPVLLKDGNILLRIVESDHGLEAKVGKLTQSQLNSLATGIIRKFPVRRVFLDLTPKPLSYIEYGDCVEFGPVFKQNMQK